MDWYQIKQAMTAATGISQDAFHILAGVALQLGFAAALRRKVAHWLPWLLVLVLAAANEWSDLRLEIWPNRDDQWLETVKDMVVTMTLPTLLMALARFAPGLFAAPRRS